MPALRSADRPLATHTHLRPLQIADPQSPQVADRAFDYSAPRLSRPDVVREEEDRMTASDQLNLRRVHDRQGHTGDMGRRAEKDPVALAVN